MALGRGRGRGGVVNRDHRRSATGWRYGPLFPWGVGVSLWDELSLATFRNIWQQPNLLRAIVNSMAIGIIGGALAVVCYLFVGIAMHRKPDNVTRFLDYSVLVPRAVPGLLAGLAFLWVFLFVPMWLDQSLKNGWLSTLPVADWLREHLIVQLRALRNTIFSVWLAYTVVWMAYGLRLISSTLLQVAPELEEAARSTGASRANHPPRHRSAGALRAYRLGC